NSTQVKRCYICCEEESFDEPSVPPKVWVHACRCTLVAHEMCLLRWMYSVQQNPSRATNFNRCPQCNTKYELEGDRPLILRVMDSVNNTVSMVMRYSVLGPVAVVVVVAATSVGRVLFQLSTTYGQWAFKQLYGKQMYDLLLTDDPTRWPWHAQWMLPMIAHHLIEFRKPKFDLPAIVPLFLAWSSTPPARVRQGFFSMLLNPLGRRYDSNMFGPLFSWPPPPIMITALYPVVTGAYRFALYKLRRRILGMPPTSPEPTIWQAIRGMPLEPAAAGRAGNANGNAQPAQGGADQEQDENHPAVAAAENLRQASYSLMRLACGSLAVPAVANFMGSVLYRLADYSSVLHHFLAIRPPLQRSDLVRLRQPLTDTPGGIDFWGSLRLVACGTRAWAESDPVWWRNLWGLGIFCVVKDSIELLHLYLKKRELETCKIVDRPFEGVDISSLDLIDWSDTSRPDSPAALQPAASQPAA
ncbi:hypothetical protein OBBRIDRAFT_726388, partial [Obba rivulosa]